MKKEEKSTRRLIRKEYLWSEAGNSASGFFYPITIQKLLYIEKLVAKRTIKTITKVFIYINCIKKARFMK